ncbi:MAG: hypothetical protein HY209_06760 [Candidatus Omnitrophica bacterium]|nr:hypothetical protein [Candidatus Omnitrophota bacterium]
MSSNPHDVPLMVSVYQKLFLWLSIITLIGIALAFLHISVLWLVIVLGIAFIITKGLIVFESFKSLLTGRHVIVIVFILTAIFVIGLLFLPVLNHHDYIIGTDDISKQLLMEQKDEGPHHGD